MADLIRVVLAAILDFLCIRSEGSPTTLVQGKRVFNDPNLWTGIGAAGTFLVGVMFYGDPSSLARYFGVALIVAGVVVLKLAH